MMASHYWRVIAVTVAVVLAAIGTYSYRELTRLRVALDRATPDAIDIGFASSMILHHQQAVAMAEMMIDGRHPGLAHSIAYTQLEELGELRGWLRLWDQPPAHGKQDMSWLLLGTQPLDAELSRYLLDCRRSSTGMPGLATMDQLEHLRLAKGRNRERQFLDLMLDHHRGALPMLRFAEKQARSPAVRDIARRMLIEQTDEIMRIEALQRVLAAGGANNRGQTTACASCSIQSSLMP